MLLCSCIIWLVSFPLTEAVDNLDIEIDELRGLQMPPPFTGYYDQFNMCGEVNSEIGNSRRKRSISRKFNKKKASHEGDDYILNGDDVANYFYPWLGKLQKNNYNYECSVFGGCVGYRFNWVKHLCTLSIISSRHALTANHCLPYRLRTAWDKTITDISPDDRRIVFGNDAGYRKSQNPIAEIQTDQLIIRNIEKVHISPRFHSRDHDFALLEFNDIKFTNRFRPICLPINGMPIDVNNVIHAGYGWAGLNATTGEKYHKELLQEMRSLTLTKGGLEPSGIQYILEKPSLSFPPRDPDIPFDKTNHFMVDTGPGDLSKRAICKGDSGGPIMWQFPNTNKFHILGILTNDIGGADFIKDCNFTAKERNLKIMGMKVTFFLSWIVEKMQPPAAQDNYCLHKDCKNSKANNVPIRTWMINEDGTPRLRPPCGRREKDTYVCPVDIRADRNILVSNDDTTATQIRERWRFCEACNFQVIDWKTSNYLDEITCGSFIQPAIPDLEEVPDQNLLPKPERNSKLPSNLCDIFAEESDHVYCPSSVSTHAEATCILSEHICDGHDDCPDGWDESPHHCIGNKK